MTVLTFKVTIADKQPNLEITDAAWITGEVELLLEDIGYPYTSEITTTIEGGSI